jgi:hypothetical protein
MADHRPSPRLSGFRSARRGALLVLVVVLVAGVALSACGSEPSAALALPPPTQTPPATATAPKTLVSPEPELQAPEFSFAVCGDSWKDNPVFREIIARANAEGDAFLVVVGDITPQGLPDQFAEFESVVAASKIPVYAVPGNHDVLNNGLDEFVKLYPEHYSFDHELAHFAMVDDSGGMVPQGELEWLEKDLAATTQPVKFVFLHVPPILFSNTPQPAGSPEPPFLKLMEQYRVADVFSGDLHAFRRFRNNQVNYIITGGAGSPLHLPSALGGYYHFVRVTVHGGSVSDEVIPIEVDY